VPRQYGGGGGGGITWPLTSAGDMGFQPDGVANNALTIKQAALSASGLTLVALTSGGGVTIDSVGALKINASVGSGNVIIGANTKPATLTATGSPHQLSSTNTVMLTVQDNQAGGADHGLTLSAGSVTNAVPVALQATGAAANLDFTISGKGTGVINFGTATRALGGGAAPTLGTIGGTGPAAAAQNSWLVVKVAGTLSYIPLWR
jgi:hypothetical protein